MKMLNVSGAVLLGFLFGGSGALVAMENKEEKAQRTASEFYHEAFSLENFLKKPEIKLSEGKILRVVLDKKLNNQLEDEQISKNNKITCLFLKRFEAIDPTKISSDVVGFYFSLENERVYLKTFLGENAK